MMSGVGREQCRIEVRRCPDSSEGDTGWLTALEQGSRQVCCLGHNAVGCLQAICLQSNLCVMLRLIANTLLRFVLLATGHRKVLFT